MNATTTSTKANSIKDDLIPPKKWPRRHKFLFHLDEPTTWDPRVRWLRLSGWCVARNGAPLHEIRARLREEIFPGKFEYDRPDVLSEVQVTGAPLRCGFVIPLFLPAGAAQLVIEAVDAEGVWHQVHTRMVRGSMLPRAGQRLWCDLDSEQPYNFWFDLPNDWSTRTRQLHLSGWCFAKNPPAIRELRARIGENVFAASYGIQRPDVAAVFNNQDGSLRSGFDVDAILPRTYSTLVMEARRDTTAWEVFYSRRVRGARKVFA
jgi:hypothetical protein